MRHATYYNDGETYRFMTGLRGEMGAWDWETAGRLVARRERGYYQEPSLEYAEMQEALNDPTPAGYNAVQCCGIDTNIDRALIDVYRKNETELALIDFKMSNAELFEMPGQVRLGSWPASSGVRNHSMDDRDPRLDGTIPVCR